MPHEPLPEPLPEPPGAKLEAPEEGKPKAREEELEKADISHYHGPGAEGDPMGFLLGAENLPMVGAAGVLVLPKRLDQMPQRERKKKAQARHDTSLQLDLHEHLVYVQSFSIYLWFFDLYDIYYDMG